MIRSGLMTDGLNLPIAIAKSLKHSIEGVDLLLKRT